ncbi:T9SS type B sorting domain-containing protein [Flavobacterium terrisoli]|uniref:T9SS type B sorting domain-containing protein n=1 Tax=Flavobacterium terrisoli TaxID=3242195 RepID=UPI0025434409|nr:T9SS type B sorting domain-containing protein [Flavobacterium buctense]
MNKKIFFFFLLIPIISFGQDFQWARQLGNGETDRIIAMDVDDDGNSYLLGESTSYYFDINPGLATEIIENNTINISGNICYMVKLDPDGNYVWGKVFNMVRSTSDYVIDMKIGTDNNIYALMVLREYSGNTVISNPNIVIVKLDLSGNELMVKSIKDLNNQQSSIDPSSFDLDSSNNIFLTGRFVGNITLSQQNPAFNLSAVGLGNYVVKMNSNGNIIWTKTYDWQHTEFESVKIGPDNNPNLLYHIFVPSTNPSIPSYYEEKLIKLDNANGNEIWEKNFENIMPSGFHISDNGNYVITFSHFVSNNPVDVDPSSNVINATETGIILWLNSNGVYIDHKEYPEPNSFFSVIESDANNNYYFATSFMGIIDVDPSPNTFLLDGGISSQHGESYVVKFDSNRNFETAFRLGRANGTLFATYKLRFSGIKIKNDYQYYCGYFAGNADLDPSANIQNFDAVHNGVLYDDGFVIKLGPCDNLMPTGDGNQTFCSGQNATISSLSPNFGSIRWYSSLTSTTPLTTNTLLINGQTYYAAKQVGNCPESPRLAVTVTINQSPLAPVAGNQTFCESENATLSNLIVPGQNLTFYDTLTGTNILPNTTVLLDNTNYYASQTVNSCESNRTAINVTVTPSIIPNVISPQTFCIQQNATLSDIAITGQNIKWYDTPTAGNLLGSTTLLQNGVTYYASQTLNSCESSLVPVTITIQNTPTPTGNSPQTLCASQNPTLDDIVLTGTTINWYSSNSSTIVLPSNTLLADGATYFATQTVNGCESINRLSITVGLIFSLNAIDYNVTFCDIGNDGSQILDLSLYNAQITSLAGNSFSYYSSFNGAENLINTEQLATNYLVPLGQSIIYVRIDNINGCHQIIEFELNLVSVPVITLPDEISLCENNSVTISAPLGFDLYAWSTGISSSSIVVSTPGDYSLTVGLNHGTGSCLTTEYFTVVLSNAPTITSIDTVDWTDTENSITVNVTGLGDYEYSIDGINFQSSNVFNGLPNGAYLVTVRDKKECGIDTERVFLLNYPKFFTPNGDGNNDGWSIKFSQFEPNFEVLIFDRYGKLLTVMENNQAWDGNYNGRQLPSDDYWFYVIRNDGRIHKGHFAMLR